MAMQRDVLPGDLQARGFLLIEGEDGKPARDIEEVADSVGVWPESLDGDLIGDRVMTLKYDAAKARSAERQAYFTCEAFPLHTDLAYIPDPPRWIVMQCVFPGGGMQGLSTLADSSTVVERLTRRDIEILSSASFRFAYPPGCRRGFSDPEPVLKSMNGTWRVRYRLDILEGPASTRKALCAFQAALEETEQTIRMGKGDTLVIDNHRILHGRTAFDPMQSGGRTLLRTYAWT